MNTFNYQHLFKFLVTIYSNIKNTLSFQDCLTKIGLITQQTKIKSNLNIKTSKVLCADQAIPVACPGVSDLVLTHPQALHVEPSVTDITLYL